MSFGEAIKTCFAKYADFSGRARRSEYWFWALFTMLVSAVLTAIGNALFGAGTTQSTLLAAVFSLATLIPGLAVIWRRLHDIGKSGASFLLVLIPIVGAIILLVRVCKDSQPGENQYGPNPKEVA